MLLFFWVCADAWLKFAHNTKGVDVLTLTLERQQQIAWQVYVRIWSKQPAYTLSTKVVHDTVFGVMQRIDPIDTSSLHIYGFAEDLIAEVIGDITHNRDDAVEYEVDDESRGDIALAMIVDHLFKKGFHLGKNTVRQIGAYADEFGIANEEAVPFMRIVIDRLVERVFTKY